MTMIQKIYHQTEHSVTYNRKFFFSIFFIFFFVARPSLHSIIFFFICAQNNCICKLLLDLKQKISIDNWVCGEEINNGMAVKTLCFVYIIIGLLTMHATDN